MAGKDPFGLGDDEDAPEDDLDRTIVEPVRPRAPAPEAEPKEKDRPPAKPPAKLEATSERVPPAPTQDPVRLDLSSPGTLRFGRVGVDLRHGNLLISAGARLLRLATMMSEAPDSIPDLASARYSAEEGVVVFEAEAEQYTLDPREADTARFVLCALIDDLALNGPWADKDLWRSDPLVGDVADRADVSQRVFNLVESAQGPEADIRVAELLYTVMALGYSGTLRTDARGPLVLTQHRAQLLRRIREIADDGKRTGAVSFGGGGTSRGLALLNPLTMAIAGLLVVVGSLALAVWLYGRDEGPSSARIDGAPILAPVRDVLPERMHAALASDVDAGLLTVRETESALILEVPAGTTFEADGKTISANGESVLRRLGIALSQGTGPVYLVTTGGASGLRSVVSARARAVQSKLVQSMSDSSRLVVISIGQFSPAIDGEAANADFPDGMMVVMRKNVRPASLSADRYLQPAWF